MAEFKEHFKKVLAETFNEMTGKSTIEDPTTKDPTAEDLTEAIARQIDIKTSSQDATSIKGKVVDDSEIGDGKALVYSGVKDKIIYKRVGRGFIGGAVIEGGTNYTSFVEVKPNSATDLAQTIAAYWGDKTILVPNGTYQGDQITIPDVDGGALIGVGKKVVIKLSDGLTDKSVLKLVDSDWGVLDNLYLDGNRTNQTSTNNNLCNGLFMYGISKWNISRIKILNCLEHGVYSNLGSHAWAGTNMVNTLQVYNCTDVGLYLNDMDSQFENTYVQYCGEEGLRIGNVVYIGKIHLADCGATGTADHRNTAYINAGSCHLGFLRIDRPFYHGLEIKKSHCTVNLLYDHGTIAGNPLVADDTYYAIYLQSGATFNNIRGVIHGMAHAEGNQLKAGVNAVAGADYNACSLAILNAHAGHTDAGANNNWVETYLNT
jgi:hypothetical protein